MHTARVGRITLRLPNAASCPLGALFETRFQSEVRIRTDGIRLYAEVAFGSSPVACGL